jgi:hypothetical protein
VLIQLRARNVVNAKFALVNNGENLLDSDIAGVIGFQSTPSNISAIMDREYDGVKNGFILRVERAVDEDAVVVFGFKRSSGTTRH